MNTQPNRALGKGLSALISDDYSQTADNISDIKPINEGSQTMHISVERLVSGKFQPRRIFNDIYIKELADSIERNGIMQPIIIRNSNDHPDHFEIIAGERRWRAAQMAGLEEVPVILRSMDDKQALELALIENIQRQDLSPLEEAGGYLRLVDEFGYTQEQLADSVGKSRSHVANLMRLLSLPELVKQYLEEEKITMGHARALLKAEEPENLVQEVINRGLNVRQTENLCKSGIIKPDTENKKQVAFEASAKDKDPDIIALENTLSESLGMKVNIEDKGLSGKIIISYDSLGQLDNLLQKIGS